MPPKITDFISRILGYFIISAAGILYLTQVLTKPGQNFTAIGLSAFASVGALAGLAFAFIPCLSEEHDKQRVLYAGEKFLHSALLLLQCVLLKFAAGYVGQWSWLRASRWVEIPLRALYFLCLLSLTTYAFYFALYGFEALNDLLWRRYHVRLKAGKDRDP